MTNMKNWLLYQQMTESVKNGTREEITQWDVDRLTIVKQHISKIEDEDTQSETSSDSGTSCLDDCPPETRKRIIYDKINPQVMDLVPIAKV